MIIDETNAIVEFRGENRFLSNFHPCTVRYQDLAYPSSEHAYQAAKSLDPAVRERIAKCRTAAQAKRKGREIPLTHEFMCTRHFIMYEIVRNKFIQNRELTRALLSTRPKFLVEGNTWGDTFWGVCDGKGLNWLGHILMQQREEFYLWGLPQ